MDNMKPFEGLWRPKRLWWHRSAEKRHNTFKKTKRGRQRTAERKFVSEGD